MKKRDVTIPTHLVSPVVKKYLANYETSRMITKFRPNMTNSWTTPSGWTSITAGQALADSAGMELKQVERIVKNTYKNSEFNTIDRLFCAMGDPLEFWLDGGELQEHYYSVDLTDVRQGEILCQAKGCTESFYPHVHNKKFCSDKCRKENHRKNNVEKVRAYQRKWYKEKSAKA